MMTLQELETALDSHQLECLRSNGRWIAVRRNGRTKHWKRDTSRFAVPCKTGLRDYFCIASDWAASTSPYWLTLDTGMVRIKEPVR